MEFGVAHVQDKFIILKRIALSKAMDKRSMYSHWLKKTLST